MIGDQTLNKGLFDKANEAKWKGKATDFEGIVVKSMSISAGLAKQKMLQQALKGLSTLGVPVDIYVLPQLLQYAQEHSSRASGNSNSSKSVAPVQDVPAESAVVQSSSAPSAACAPAADAAANGTLPKRRKRAA